MIDELDKILLYLYQNRKRHRAMDLNKVLDIPTNDLSIIGSEIVLEKLFKDGYAERDQNETKSPRYWRYSISVEGILFLERSDLKNRPYRAEIRRNKLRKIWDIAKITAVIMNAFAIIGLSWLTISVQKDASQLEKNRKNDPPPIINVIIDTVKKK